MSGIGFPSDTSTQTISSITPVGTYNPIINSNSLYTSLSAKQDTLTAATSLLGVGSAITALDYNKITLNKPSVFPADMTNIYSKTETNNLLNAKQDTLTAATSLLGVGSAITALDYNKITLNKPSVFPADMTNIYSKTEVNNISVLINYPNYTVLNSCNYITNSITNRFSILTGTFGVPTNGTTGGNGDRILLWPGSGTAPPYSIGIDTATMWYSTPALTSHKFYIGNSVIFSFNTTTGGIFTGTLNSTVALQEAGVSLNNKYSSYTALNSCNYITNSTTGLINYPNYTVLNSCNYITNTTTGLINYPNYTVLNSCNYITNASLATTYLKLDGTNSMTGALSVGTTTSKQQLTIQAATPAMIRVQTNTDTTNQVSGIEFGIPAYTSVLCAKITSTTGAGNANDLKFFTNATSGTGAAERLRIDKDGILYTNNTLIVGNNNSYPNIQLGSTNGNNLAVSTTATSFSSSSGVNDLILRSINNLLLQSGTGAYCAKINNNNNFFVNKKLYIDSAPADTKAAVQTSIFSSIPTFASVFSGDSIWTSYWGCAVCLNAGGFANGGYSADASQTFTTGYSSFTVNIRTSTAATSFDKTLFTVRNSGNVGINVTTDNATLHINSASQLQPRILIAGQEFYQTVAQGGGNSTDGIALLMGVNRSGNRQLWIGDSANLSVNANNGIIRIIPGIDNNTIDSLATNGQNRLNLTLGSSTTIIPNGNVGIFNNTPFAPLCVGRPDIASDGHIVLSKNSGGNRNCLLGYNSQFYFTITDFGNLNATTGNTRIEQLGILYSAPSASLTIEWSGRVVMPYGFGLTSSDERIKTNIKTIENALDKVLLLRGVEYNDIRIDPDEKKFGLIAQEVEIIIPEIVKDNDLLKHKTLDYVSLIPYLIEAVKEQQKQINKMKELLQKNNII